MDKLREIETFVAVVAEQSFAGAARKLGLTPAIIGRRISQIEERLGGVLLVRSTRKLDLTPQGEEFHRHCKVILTRLETAERLVSDGRKYATGHLILSAPAAFGRRHVAPHLPPFMRENPDVRVSLNLSDHITDLVREGYEVAIRLGPVIDTSLVQVRLATNRAVLCAAPGYLRERGTPLVPADLAHHNCLAFNEYGGQPRGWHFLVDDRPVTFRPSGTLSCNDGEVLAQWLREGRGIGWRSLWEVAAELSCGALVTVLDDHMPPGYDVTAVYPVQPHLPAKIGLLIEWLRTVYARPGYWEAP
ncbi:LysR family transcriptional regulator [Shinella sp. HZN7]|uniref:LysR family transcriptional regulator n=1 Tax=Shinella sp. (strain HZN7) TaxID=879274 RepID=UPI0007DA597A|nr:LysR family transcriptional regulator [Shinella sp. HZN7]ANH08086.1 LysR family transcriptional regulator [Shinella sp. HZN7]